MKLQVDKSVVTLTPEGEEEKRSLEHLWKLLIDCNGPTLTLCPIGEFIPALNDKGAQFFIEGMARSNDVKLVEFSKSVEYKPVIVEEDCTVYCRTCNKTIDLKKGDAIPLCCGKLMEIID